MQNIIVGAGSQSGKREINEGDIGTSRGKIKIPGLNGHSIDHGIDLSTNESTKEGARTLVENFGNKLKNGVNFSFHAMNMGKMINDYPEVFIKEFLEKIGELDTDVQKSILEKNYELNALLISFHGEYSEENPNGSHASYGAREKKKELEMSLLNSDAKKKKIIDLEIFDSPSSKALGFTYLGVLGQYIDFLESFNNQNHQINEIKGYFTNFLGEDYLKIKELFDKYPLSGELKEGQISMKDMNSEDLKSLMNEVVGNINGAKLSYLSGVLSEDYLLNSMNYLKNNKDKIFKPEGDRILLDLKTVTQVNEDNSKNYIKESIKVQQSLKDKLEKKLENTGKENLVFQENGEQEENTRRYIFNPTENNFNIIGKHFGVIPLIITNGLIYISGLLEKGEYIKSTKASSMMYTGNELLVEKIINKKGITEIIISNIDNSSEIFATITIGNIKDLEKKEISEKGVVFEVDKKEFDNSIVPHSKEWFDTFNKKGLVDKPFGLELDPKAVILEDIGVQIATKYFMNPKEGILEKLKENFKRMPDFGVLKGIFGEVSIDYIIEGFEKEIKNIDYNFKITNVSGRTNKDGGIAVFKVDVYNNDNLLLSQHTFKVA